MSSEAAAGTPGYGRPLQVMSLLFSRGSGNLANLSAVGAGNDPTRGGPGTDWLSGGAGDDIINPGDNDGEYDWVLGSRGSDLIVYTDSGASAYQALSYIDLDRGIEATVDGGANRGRITKGSAEADTIVDVANPLNAGRQAPYGGFGLTGSPYNDTFDLRLADGQWMEVRGEAGADTINIRSGRVKVSYQDAPGAVDVDLGAGRGERRRLREAPTPSSVTSGRWRAGRTATRCGAATAATNWTAGPATTCSSPVMATGGYRTVMT